MGVLTVFSTGTYAIIGTTCVESETCYEKYQEKNYKKKKKKEERKEVRKKERRKKEEKRNKG